MENNSYLNEQKYQTNKKKISRISIIILIIGLLIGALLITLGIIEKNKVNSKYSEENKQNEIKRIETEIQNEENILKNKKNELESKGIKYDVFANYDDGERYELKIVTKIMDPSFNNCAFDEYKNNTITKKYCSLKNELKDIQSINVEFERNFNSSGSTLLFIFGSFIIIFSSIISGFIYTITKRREIIAFTAQQMMPIAQEGIEKMAPTIGEIGKTMTKEMTPIYKEMAQEMAPVYKEIAKEIAKGIKEGTKEEK